jgi:hypothetical protein
MVVEGLVGTWVGDYDGDDGEHLFGEVRSH